MVCFAVLFVFPAGAGRGAGAPTAPSGGAKTAGVSKRDALQAELDEYVASECVFCGDIMIRSIV